MSILTTALVPLFLNGGLLNGGLLNGVAIAPVDAVASHAKPAPITAPAPQSDPRLVRIQAPAPAAALDRTAIIDRAGKALGGVKTAQGKFMQIDPYGEQSSGDFYINRPGKIRFDYVKPEPMHIVSDGVSVSIEEPKRDAYDAVPLASTSFNLFLKDTVNLQKAAKVKDVATSNGSHFVTLEDSTGEAEGKIILEFRASDFELMGWRSVDTSGGETKVQLTDVKTNVQLRPSLFVVRDPNDDDHR